MIFTSPTYWVIPSKTKKSTPLFDNFNMRVVAFLFASAIAVSSATAITQDSNTAELLKRCNEPGEACYQVKRAASAAALALARPDATPCGDNAECHLVKRTNEELLKELTDIAHDYNPEDPGKCPHPL